MLPQPPDLPGSPTPPGRGSQSPSGPQAINRLLEIVRQSGQELQTAPHDPSAIEPAVLEDLQGMADALHSPENASDLPSQSRVRHAVAAAVIAVLWAVARGRIDPARFLSRLGFRLPPDSAGGSRPAGQPRSTLPPTYRPGLFGFPQSPPASRSQPGLGQLLRLLRGGPPPPPPPPPLGSR